MFKRSHALRTNSFQDSIICSSIFPKEKKLPERDYSVLSKDLEQILYKHHTIQHCHTILVLQGVCGWSNSTMKVTHFFVLRSTGITSNDGIKEHAVIMNAVTGI